MIGNLRIHNQNLDVFEFFIDEDVDNFDYYVVAPLISLSRAATAKGLKIGEDISVIFALSDEVLSS